MKRAYVVKQADLRMDGNLAMNVKRVLPVTQADFATAVANGQAWNVMRYHVVNSLDNMRGGTMRILKVNAPAPGVQRAFLTSETTIITVMGVPPLVLPDAVEDDIVSLKAFGGTEQRNLPAEYTELEYIESTGTQYIDTGIVPKTFDYDIETVFAFSEVNSTATPLCAWGYMGAATLPRWLLASYQSGYLLNPNTTSVFGSQDTSKHTFLGKVYLDIGEAPKWSAAVDGTIIRNNEGILSNSTFSENTLSIYIFARHNANGAGNFASGKLYRHTVTKAGAVIQNLLPAKRNSDNVVGMYDTVSGTFFTNDGTGNFVAGASVTPTPDAPMDIVCNNGVLKARHQSGLPLGYTLLDYIESTGTQYINTGVMAQDLITKQGASIKLKLSFSSPLVSGFHVNGWGNNPQIGLSGDKWQNYNTGTEKVSANTIYEPELDCYTGVLSIDGFTSVVAGQLSVVAQPFYLFAMSDSSSPYTATKFVKQRLYRATFKGENGVVIHDFIPVKYVSGNTTTYGMYDLMDSNPATAFYTNAGTDDFTAGNEVSDPVEIYADGTVETINVHTKNLFSGIVEQGGLSDGTGSETTSSARIRTTAVPVKQNTTYNLSWTTNSGMAVVIRNAHFYNASNTWLGRLNASTFTTPPDTAFVRFVWQRSDSTSDVTPSDISNVQLELGSTATAYVPYFNGGTATAEMLLKVGDYQDEQEVISGGVTRKVGVKVLDGTETWTDGSSSNVFVVSVSDKKEGKNTSLCTAYTYNSGSQAILPNGTFGMPGAGASMFFKDTRFNTASDFASWLADQYAAGTPVIVVYPLATPTTESVAGQTLQVTDGDNMVEITQASMSGLELEVTYNAGVVLTVEEVEDAQLSPDVEVTIQ